MIADQLLLQITKCPVLESCRSGENGSKACSRVVSVQGGTWSNHHLPEPWNGDLETARVLFVSSNPAIDKRERYPTPEWPDDLRVDFFRRRFSGGREPWTDRFRTLMETGEHDRAPRAGKYWSEIHQRAVELLGPSAKPGIDYALTEVVHCKSSSNIGVPEARDTCASLYLLPVLEASSAPVIVVIGKHARQVFQGRFGGPPKGGSKAGVAIGGHERMLIAIGAPNSSEPRKLTAPNRYDDLLEARRRLDYAHA